MKDQRPKEFSSVGGLIRDLLGDQLHDSENAPEREEVQAEIRRLWGRCAGRAADASIPLLFRSGRLVIFTESAIWATELRHQQSAIRKELESFNIKEIEVKARPGILPPARPNYRQATLSEKSRHHLQSTASRLNHKGLRNALQRLSQKNRSPQR